MQINWNKLIRSKTIWANFIALVALAVQTSTGMIIDLEAQASVIIVVNLVLRMVTHEGLIENDR